MALFEGFLRWKPIPPKSAKELVRTVALLCRLLRDEVTEQLSLKSEALTSLATDWRKLFFRMLLTNGSPTDTHKP